ncbi:MAG: hypothetical protein OJF49_004135 [Ktedonobacterales bacterium]|jgi:O-antigen ligase|nr:MAG: hypothetical protein OJF49_004135 [Ktedonobacterales bacterium]
MSNLVSVRKAQMFRGNTAVPRWLGATVGCVLVWAVLLALPRNAGTELLAGLAVVVAAGVSPLAGLCLIPWSAAFGSLFTVTLHGFNVSPTELLIAGLVVSCGVRWLREQGGVRDAVAGIQWRTLPERVWVAMRTHRLYAAVFGTLLLYLGVIVLSLLVASDRAATVKEIIKWAEVVVALALGVWVLRRSAARVRIVAWAMIAAGVAEALVGYAQWALSPGGASSAEAGRVFGTFGQPNPYAGYLNLSLPIALALALFGEDARERWVAGAASVLLLGSEFFSASRGGEIGLAAALVVLLAVGLRRECVVALVGGVGVAVVAIGVGTHLIPQSVVDAALRPLRLNGISLDAPVTNANFSTMERLAHWVAGLRMFRAHPLLGVGAGNYDAAYAQFATNLSVWPESLGHAHNYYINVAAETGALGLLAFLAASGAMLWLGWRATRATRASTGRPYGGVAAGDAGAGMGMGAGVPVRALALGLFAALVALMVHNLTDNLFVHDMETQVALCVVCLLCLAGYGHDGM